MSSSPLLNDLYQFTMAYGYWREGLAGQRASFYASFRRPPFGGGFVAVAGLDLILDAIESWRFEPEHAEHLRSLRHSQGGPLFDPKFVEMLEGLELDVDIDAAPEGTVVGGGVPVLRVEGPLLQAQILETPILNLLNASSLVATKSARVCHLAAKSSPVVDFGLRRAHGPNGAILASRSAYLGGCAATSNVEAGARFEIPVRGTHAHSWVLAWGDELEAFRAFARSQPHNCSLLIDTYDVGQGVENALTVARELMRDGARLQAVRIDSGDLAEVSRRVRTRLDEAGFPDVKIMASGDLDEYRIRELRSAGAPIDQWGVGTKLVVGWGDPALSGVYKLSALRDEATNQWRARFKRRVDGGPATLPGRVQVLREQSDDGVILQDRLVPIESAGAGKPLLAPVWRARERVGAGRAGVAEARATLRAEIDRLPTSSRRLFDAVSLLVAGTHELPTGES